MEGGLTLHIPQAELFPSQTVRRTIHIYDRFLSQCYPYNALGRWICLTHALDNLVNGRQSGLAQSVNIRAGYVPEVDSATDTIRDVMGFAEPLIRFEESSNL